MTEAILAMFVTLIVMATIFGFLASGARTSTVEMDRADLQAQTRHALDQISRDVLIAGYGLPPEFPSFGNETGPGNSSATERIEIRGMAGNTLDADPIAVTSFDGRTARVADLPPSLSLGQPVLVYDDLPVDGSWVLGLVSGIRTQPTKEVEVVTKPGASVSASGETVSLPVNMARYNRAPNGPPESGFLTPVSIVSYELTQDASDSMPTLMRQVNWGARSHVAHIESMEIRYLVGGTLTGPVIESAPRGGGMRYRRQSEDKGESSNAANPRSGGRSPNGEILLSDPPVPQPNPGAALNEGNVVRAVSISLTGRSRHANLVGSRLKPDEQRGDGDELGFVRQTLNTRVATRNLSSRAELRRMQLETLARSN